MKTSKIIGTIVKAGVAIAALVGTIGGTVYFAQKSIKKESDLQKRYRAYYELTNRWLANKNDDKNIKTFFETNDIQSIAVYGMGTLGEMFYEDIKKTDVSVKYFIDKNAEELYCGMDNLPVVGLTDIKEQEKVDAVIVTPVFDYDSIVEDLEEADETLNTISLEDVIYNV